MGTTTLFEYDNYGNITRKCIADYTPDDDEDVHTVYNYTYAKGRLKSYGGKNCEYDNIGNPTTYLGKSAEWKGKQLTKFNGITFEYDGKGRRIKKKITSFTYDCEGNLVQQSDGMSFFYDSQGVSGFAYGGSNYYYKKDALGNVIAILDATGATVASYEYNAWGEHSISGNTTIGNLNPFRYRSYYYDTETGLYYLQTRYYDPVTCRFLNMDSIKYAEPTSIGGLNFYSYCNNDPVNNVDPTGHFAITAFALSLILGIGLGAVISGTVSGVQAFNEGRRGLELFASIFGGAIVGGAMGAVLVLGGAAGLAATGATIAGFGLTTAGAFGASVLIGAGANLTSYLLVNGLHNDKQISLGGAAISVVSGVAQAAITFGIGFIGGKNGLFNNLGNFSTWDGFYLNMFNETGKLSLLARIFYDTSALIGNTLTRALYLSAAAAGIRMLINYLFNKIPI